MDPLSELALKYRCDKLDHQYTIIYNNLFNSIQNDHFNLLEIGVQYGDSLKMWKNYFNNAIIYGADNFLGINGNGSKIDNPLKFINEYRENKESFNRIIIKYIDQSIEDELDYFLKECTNNSIKFKIIIDDGSHLMRDQQLTFLYLFDLVENDGYYIIENVQTCDHDGYDVLPDKSNSTKLFFNNLKDGKYNNMYKIDNNILNKIKKIDILKLNDNSELIIIYKK